MKPLSEGAHRKTRALRALDLTGQADLASKIRDCRTKAYCSNPYCLRCAERMRTSIRQMARDWIRPKFTCDPTYVHENVRMVTVLCDLADLSVADVQAHVKKGRKLLTRALRPFPQLWVSGAFDFEVVNTDLVLVQKGAPKNARLVDDLLQGEIVADHRKILVHMHLLVDLNGVDGDALRNRLASVFNVSRYQVDVSRLDRIDRSVKNYTGDDLFQANIRRIGNYMVKRTVRYKFKIKDHFRHKDGDLLEDDALSILVTSYSSMGGSGYKSILINSKPR